jgi:hypothetical protein
MRCDEVKCRRTDIVPGRGGVLSWASPAPGANRRAIRLGFDGVHRLRVNGAGNLALCTAAGTLVQRAPLAYQLGPHGRTPVAARPPAPPTTLSQIVRDVVVQSWLALGLPMKLLTLLVKP